MEKKRLLYLGLFILLCLGLGFALYLVFFRKPAPAPVFPPQPATPGAITPGAGQFPQAGTGAPVGTAPGTGELPNAQLTPGVQGATRESQPEAQKIVSAAVVSPRADTAGNVNFYNQTDGKFYRLGQDGAPQLLSDTVFYNVQKVTWSPKSDESIIEYPDGAKIYYNFATKKQVTLPKHWEDFSFAPAGDRIAAKSLGFSPENRWLIAANPDGSGVSLVAALGENADKVDVNWSPNNQIIGTSRTGEPLGADRQAVLFVGLHGENFKSTIVEGRDLRSQWSPDGKKLLYSVYSAGNDFKPQLWVVNAEGDAIGSGRHPLNLNTWADKCAFSQAQVAYCGVPDSLEVGAGFAPALANNTPDHLFRVDLQTGIRTEIPLKDSHVIDHIFSSPDGKKLYFTDKNQAGVFAVTL